MSEQNQAKTPDRRVNEEGWYRAERTRIDRTLGVETKFVVDQIENEKEAENGGTV